MNFKKTMFALAIGSIGIMGAMSAHAFDLNAGDKLTITAGVQVVDADGYNINVSSGSFFVVDANGDSKIQGGEKTALSQGSTGITIGRSNTAPGEITAPWLFFQNTGYDWVSATPITGGTGGLDMSGWTVTWDVLDLPLGTGAWQVNASSGMPTSGYTNGVGIFNWSGVYGDFYTLDYTATVQSGPFVGVKYALHLEGVTAVPEASTYGMMLAGLGLVGIAARRRKQSEV
jgi:hypothetical protein